MEDSRDGIFGDDDEEWEAVLSTMDVGTGTRSTMNCCTPYKQGCPKRIANGCIDAHCVPDTPSDAPSTPVPSLTPSALALLQPAAPHQAAALQQRGVHAPPDLFPGFATWEKLSVLQSGPSTEQPMPKQPSEISQHELRAAPARKQATDYSLHGSREHRAPSGAACHSMGQSSAQDKGASLSWAGASSGSMHADGQSHSSVRTGATCNARLGSSASSEQPPQRSGCPDLACQAPKQQGGPEMEWAQPGSSPPARPALQPRLQQHMLIESQHRSGAALLEASMRGLPPWAQGRRPVTCAEDIHARVQEFQHVLPRLPLPPASHTECPGVFKTAQTGCGAPLRPWARSVTLEDGRAHVFEFWACEGAGCDFREVLPSRLKTPQLALEAVSAAEGFQVVPALGAQQMVAFCGGIYAVLIALRVDVRAAFLPQGPQSKDSPSQGLVPIAFPWEEYGAVVTALRRKGQDRPDLLGKAGTIPDSALKAMRGQRQILSKAEVDARLERMPASLAKALLPFQMEGVRFGIQHGGRMLLADEMGVGKTVQAIALASCYQDCWPLLVVVPASLRLAWAEELAKWLPHVRPSQVHVIEGRTDRLSGSDLPQVVITSYDMLARLTCNKCTAAKPGSACTGPEGCMTARKFKVVIMDESHTLKTADRAPDSTNTEAAVAAVKAAQPAVLLTGTPSLSRPFDLYRQVDALRPGLLGPTRDAFAHRYCARHTVPVGRSGVQRLRWCNTGLSHGPELHALLKQEVMLRRLKREVMGQLPPKRRQVVRLPPPEAKHWPKEFRQPFEDDEDLCDQEDTQAEEDQDDSDRDCSEQGEDGKAMSLGRATALAKLPSALEWLRHALGAERKATSDAASGADAAPKFLIFAHHKDVMKRLAQDLEGAGSAEWPGVGYVQIDGSMDQCDRRKACQSFRSDPAIRVALLSVMAAGVGVDFTAASAVVFVELPDEVSILLQAEDRAHRHGQELPVNIYFLLARGTADERKWQRLNRSLETVTAVHDGESSVTEGAAGADNCRGGGIAVHMVKEVGAQLGWACTQLAPEQAPTFLQAPHVAGEAIAAASSSGEEGLAAETANGAGLQLAPRLAAEFHLPPFGAVESIAAAESQAYEMLSAGHSDLAQHHDSQQSRCPPAGAQQQPSVNASREERAELSQPGKSSYPSQSHGNVKEALPDSAPQAEAAQLPVCAGIADQAKVDPGPPPLVYFEVGQHTNRVHFHGKEDGSDLLGLSLPLDLLSAPENGCGSSTIQDLLSHVESRKEDKVHFGQAGLLALPGWVTAPVLAQWLQEARDFAAEWVELRALHQNKLCGRCLRAPLQAYVDEVEAEARAGGAYGIGTERHLDGLAMLAHLPAGVELATVSVLYHGRVNPFQYKQAFTEGGERLCIKCLGQVPGCTLAPQATLQGAGFLFCSPKCEAEYIIVAGGSALRRSLRDLERGVCQLCKLDCLQLVKRLRLIEKGSKGWMRRREGKLKIIAPKFCARGYKAAREKLVSRVLEGNAWHADHIVPVYAGGGMCQLDNLRTLCVPCHQDVTKVQAAERAAARHLQNQHTLDRYIVASSPRGAASSRATTGAAAQASKPRRQLKRLYTDMAPAAPYMEPQEEPVQLFDELGHEI